MKKIDKVIEEISKINNDSQIARYIEQNVPNELMNNEEFMQRLIASNPRVQNILEIYYGISEEKVVAQIEEKGLKNSIEEDETIVNNIPRRYREQLYDLAKEYETEEDFDKAKLLYEKLIKFGNQTVAKFNTKFNKEYSTKETIYYKAKCSYYACKMKNGEPLTAEDEEELDKLAKEDKENILNLTKPGEMSKYEKYLACFDDINLEILENEILPIVTNNGTGVTRTPAGEPTNTREYSAELSPEKRFEYIKNNYKIKSVKSGAGKYTGTFIFEIEDSDVVIVERFYNTQGRKNNKIMVPSYSQATYIVHKDADIDLEKESHNVLVEKKRNEQDRNDYPLIDSCNHISGYYSRLDEKFVRIENNGRKRLKYFKDTNELEENNVEIEYLKISKQENEEEQEGKVSKEVFETNNDKEISEYTLEELIEEKLKINKKFEECKQLQSYFNEEIKQLQSEIEKLTIEMATHFKNLTPELKSVIKEEVKTLQEAKAKLEQLKELRERAIEAESKNRERATKLEEQFQNILGGE